MPNILVYIQAPAAVPTKSQREMLTLASRLGEVRVVLGAPTDETALAALTAWGANGFYAAGASCALVAPDAALLAAAAKDSDAALVLLPNDIQGREVAARAGIKLDAGVITDAIDVDADLVVSKTVLAGSYTVRVKATRGPALVTVKPNSVELPAGEPAAASAAPVQVLEFGEVGPAATVAGTVQRTASGRPDLNEARFVVAGGRGVDGDFGPVEDLADALGAAIGASRAATDAGWIDHSAQIGQTGKTVSPQLYISAGISGAIQQKAGMQSSTYIVAVNKDPDAPVFEIADLGIVGDLATVLPQAAAEIRRRKG
ncbi:electron transfer flavoprotein subunit alpha/FixB family protein [Paeniglutamicibacter kerguelensis]|uniref:Electron transfer flavoprotein alpha subunit n=1 Tax=Paeniglutamicibacter kerguelensis TaxID=254788 RepID=A0ABS4XE02_9MICC|nr:electron transfer flavoprotein subunit alpha/FixB family protein [Paeniglutamicibacter kerguelensis]MBP2386704.1 electron transfer flavoprotein alpha subunit [Paeniglutamicibacter kerguelensis]